MPNISKGLRQAFDVQDFAFDAIQALRDSLRVDGKLKVTRDDALAIKNVATVWREAQERIAFHRRVPSPGSLRPVSGKATKRKARGDDPFNGMTVYPPPGPGAEASVMRDSSACQTPVSDAVSREGQASAPRTDPPAPSAPSAAQ